MITTQQRSQATKIAAERIGAAREDRERSLRAIASALGSQDPEAVIAHLNPRVVESRMADVLVDAMVEAMEDCQAAA